MGLLDEVMVNNEPSANISGGVTTGIVKENWNKEYPGRVKVQLFLAESGKNVTGWLPVISPYAGNGYGTYMLPEVGAEVVVAFQMGSRNCPIVLGTLWNNKNKIPDKTANSKNTVKCIKTKGGCQITFDDTSKKEKVEIKTPGKLRVVIDDEKKTIQIQDEKGSNGITIDTGKGIMSMKAKKKIELCVGGKPMITLDGSTKSVKLSGSQVQLDGSQALKLKGQNSSLEGTMVSVKAKGTLKLESSAIAQLKGSMVKIN